MATLAASDIAAITAAITTQFADASDLVPNGSTVSAQVTSIYPRVLGEMNARWAGRYAELPTGDGVVLPTMALQILTWGVMAEFLYNAYRQLTDSEETWAAHYERRYNELVKAVAAGEADVPEAETNSSLLASDSEPRQLTTSPTLAESLEVTPLQDLF